MRGLKIPSLALIFVLLAATPGITTPKPNPIQQIWQRIRPKQEPPRGVRGDVCVVTPSKESVIWRDRPIFAWHGPAKQVAIYREDEPQKVLWSSPVKPEQTSVTYTGQPLSPGVYILKVLGKGDTPVQVYFEVMGGSDRDSINQKLQQLKLKRSPAGGAKISETLSRLDLWSQEGLFSDAVMEMYAAAGSDPEIETMRQNFVKLSCKIK